MRGTHKLLSFYAFVVYTCHALISEPEVAEIIVHGSRCGAVAGLCLQEEECNTTLLTHNDDCPNSTFCCQAPADGRNKTHEESPGKTEHQQIVISISSEEERTESHREKSYTDMSRNFSQGILLEDLLVDGNALETGENETRFKRVCRPKPRCSKFFGLCKRSCNQWETKIPRGCRKSFCECCVEGCVPRRRCTTNRGICKDKCLPWEIKIHKGCRGRGCKCCVASEDCRQTRSCIDRRGACKSECKGTEVLVPDGCEGNGCVCCAPDICLPTPACPGECTKHCSRVVSRHHCSNDNCVCCLNCWPTRSCINRRGNCKSECKGTEVLVPDGCEGNGCMCCAPDICLPTPACPGECTKHCSGVVARHHCSNDNCVCCLDCRPTRSCINRRGACKSDCDGAEVLVPDGCHGDGCVCCAPDICFPTPACPGECTKHCSGVVLESQCSNDNCVCCLDCQPGPTCTRLGGHCKSQCSHWEFELEGGCSVDGCKCCINDVPNCSGRKMCSAQCIHPPRCTAGESGAVCSDKPWCACCANDVRRVSCTEQGGRCTSKCEDTEVLIPDQCYHGDFCCAPVTTLCRKSPACPGQCSNECTGIVSPVSCNGINCLCCLDCNPTSKCWEQEGECRAECSCGEKEVPGECQGNGCKCCVAHVPDCSQDSSCPNHCIFQPLCTGVVIGTKCGREDGCSCCGSSNHGGGG